MKKNTYSEIELITLIKEKNQKAFSSLYDNYSQALEHLNKGKLAYAWQSLSQTAEVRSMKAVWAAAMNIDA